jgi:hypothetical protein
MKNRQPPAGDAPSAALEVLRPRNDAQPEHRRQRDAPAGPRGLPATLQDAPLTRPAPEVAGTDARRRRAAEARAAQPGSIDIAALVAPLAEEVDRLQARSDTLRLHACLR